MRRLISLVSLPILVAALPAQAAWTAVTSGTPPARAALTSGSDLTGMVIFGGNFANGTRTNEVWRFDAGTAMWSNLTPAAGAAPIGRHFGAGSMDWSRGKFVVFGGTNDGTTWLGDTWEFDLATQTWTDRTPAGGSPTPSARRWCQMAFNGFDGTCVLYGGVDQPGNYLSDTWIWNGTAGTWTQMFPANSPGPLARQRMTQKFPLDEIWMFGGRNAAGARGQTWIWRNSDWTQLPTATTPGPSGLGLFASSLAYDEIRDRFVVYGGVETSGTRPETWELDGVDWVQRSSLPSNSRSGCALAYVGSTGKTYMYGGFENVRLDDTWEYQTNAIARFAIGTSGQGCAGSGGSTPSLAGVSLPWIGDTFAIQVNGMDPNALIRAMVFNFGAPIPPLALGVLGFPACSFLAGPGLNVMLGPNDLFSLTIPAGAMLAGSSMSLQAVGVEPAPFWISASDRADVVFGLR